MAFFLKAIGLSDDIPGFPFTPTASDPGHIVYTSPLMCWTVRSGAPHDDPQKKVSIFTCSLATSSSTSRGNADLMRVLARNALRRAKSLMIPGMLKCLGATEYRDTVYIATEACISLKEVLESRETRTQLYGAAAAEYHASVAYGVSTVGEALTALHHNRLVHGNVNSQSIFVVPTSGMWRLFGLELVSSTEEMNTGSSSCVFDSAVRAQLLEGYRCPPELVPGAAAASGAGGASSSSSPAEALAVDAWGLAGLLYETMGVTVEEAADGRLNALTHTLASAELRNACRLSLPKSLHSGCSAITAANPRMRKTVQSFLESCEFVKDSSFVQHMKGLSEALLLDASQQVRLVEALADVVDGFPLRPCLCYVLPRLGELVRAAAKPGSANGVAGVSVGPAVGPVLKIAARTPAGEDFDTYVTPVLLLMFQSPDALMRYKLLVGAEVYGGKLSASALNNAVWPLYLKGFQHSTPSVREYSARALVHLAPHLSEVVLADQVPKALGLLQRDPDGALRANATIALHLISPHITPPTQRASVVLNSCRPMLRDAFEPSRVAALRSLRGAMDCLSAKQLAEAVLPAVAPLTIDPTSEESRGAALTLIKAATTTLEEHHRHLTTQQPTVLGGGSGTAATTAAAASGSPPNATATATAAAAAVESGAGSSNNGASSWGWGLFSGSPPATPAPTTAAASSTRHFDVASSSASSVAASGFPPSQRSSIAPSPTPARHTTTTTATTTSATTVLPAPKVSAAAISGGGGGGTGWSDDEDAEGAPVGAAVRTGAVKDNDGWGSDDDAVKSNAKGPVAAPPAAGVMKVRPLAPASSTRLGGLSAGGGPAPFPTTAVRTLPPASSSLSSSVPLSSGAAAAMPVGSLTGTTPSAPAAGPMKLRKKGGLGAARLD